MSLPYASHRALIQARRSIDAATTAMIAAMTAFTQATPAYQANEENRGDFELLNDAQESLHQAREELLQLCMQDAVRNHGN